jgi:hypothetical protein
MVMVVISEFADFISDCSAFSIRNLENMVNKKEYISQNCVSKDSKLTE